MRQPVARFVIGALRTLRLSRLQLAAVVGSSTLATAVVIATATGRTAAQQQALALLARGPIVHRAGSPLQPAADAALAPDALLGGGARSSSPRSSRTPAPASAVPPPAATAATATATTPATPATPKPTAGHVFVIALTTPSYRAAFGRSSVARYLNHDLRPKGTLLSGYRSLTGSELPDYLAMISGQAPTRDTRANCPSYDDFATSAKPSAAGLVTGNGCVYPNTVITLGDQVTASGGKWGAYIADMGKQACVHANSGAADDAVLPFAGDQYATRHNPFIYFHSLLDLGDCSADDADLTHLQADLRSAAKAPRYAFIAPPLCDDASVSACPDGAPAGLAGEDAFLKQWVPRILASPAYKQHGVLVLAFAPSPSASSTTGTPATAPSGETTTTTIPVPTAPTATTPTTTTPTTPTATTPPYALVPAGGAISAPTAGGPSPVRTGALILSPDAVAGPTLAGRYDPDSLLRSIEDLLGLGPLGRAKHAPSFATAALPSL